MGLLKLTLTVPYCAAWLWLRTFHKEAQAPKKQLLVCNMHDNHSTKLVTSFIVVFIKMFLSSKFPFHTTYNLRSKGLGYTSVFSLGCPRRPFWSALFLNCCRLLKIYTSYPISKCWSVKMINISWFLDPHKDPAIRINTFANAIMFILRELKDISSGEWLKKNHYEQHRNNYSILHKIRPVQEHIEIVLIFLFFKCWFLIHIFK